MDMVQFIPKVGKLIHVYIVCSVGRMYLQDWELDHYDDEIDHLSYVGHAIDDLWLEDDAPEDVEEDAQKAEDVQQEAQVTSEDEYMPEEVILVPQTQPVGNRHNGLGPQERQRRGPPCRHASTSRNKGDKGKEKVVEQEVESPKKKRGRPKKDLKRRYSTRSSGEGCSRPVTYSESDDSDDSDDPNYEGIVDSDFELDDADDEVEFHTHVDGDPSNVEEWEEIGFNGTISDEDGTASDGFPSLHGSSDESGEDIGMFPVKGKKRFSNWKEFNQFADMKNPTFELGMIFPSSTVFKKAMRKHAVLTKKELRFQKNTRHKVKVVCITSPGCPFTVYASTPDKENPNIQIKTFRPVHKCSSVEGKVYHCHAPFIADEYANFFMNDPNWTREGVQNAVGKDFGMDIGYQMAYRAKRRAVKLAQGSHEDQYNLLESYAHELKKKNPGTSVWIQTELDEDLTRFKRIYICLEPLKIGWRAGCRPIIGLDGCHLKGVHKGHLLTAVGIDGNNGIYPIAWAIVESECRDSWTWFLELLRVDLQIYHSVHYAFISDKQKGLEQAIKDLFPFSEHRHCVRHLHNNFKGDGFGGLELKQKLWAVARACTMRQYEHAMEELKKSSVGAWGWCMDRPAKHWSKSHFKDTFKCDILLNNHSESFNKSLLQARKKPILGCLEDIRTSAMVRVCNRRNSGHNWKCRVGPRVEKLLKKNAEWSHEYRALQSSEMRFEIQGRGVGCASGVITQHSVQLDKKSCSCRRWDVSGLPCGHAIAAIYSKGWSPDEFVDDHYRMEKYLEAYEQVINPIAGISEWEIIHRPIAAPLYRAQPGRPKLKRNKEPGEEPPAAGTEKLSRSFYSQVKCGRCHKKGHNVRTCLRRNQENAENELPTEDGANVLPPEDGANVQQQPEHENVQVPDNAEVPQVIHQQPQLISDNLSQNVTIDVDVVIGMQSQTSTNIVHQPQPQGSSNPVFSSRRFKSPARRIKPGKKLAEGSTSATNSGTDSTRPSWKY
ncbi:uncharacterized protein LOC112192744 [Rosa chinensis]|uniref:uncharacterized protein LOC112192744 n=1 Tax=Rosa chinensis TaxID=74649 RepID=UPI001AD8ECF8|nr:uncharacterized protein LOC112192744 [Rosa chinensis]XP_040372480.1 uncharacterized protein LOC112192744 [Rosa chinensis]